MNEIIFEKLRGYNIENAEQELNALKEISQEIILYALSKTTFFNLAFFCGGTALRIVHGVNRFSEDLDFATKTVCPEFQFDDYIEEILMTLKYYGLEMKVKKAKDDSFVKSREFKEDSDKWKITFPSNKQLKKVVIKLEIDTNPPAGAEDTTVSLDFPILHQIRIGNPETLFAGKIHALLCRKYTKGRDWYDLLWYIKQKININYGYLKNAFFQMGPYQGKSQKSVDRNFIVNELSQKIRSLNWKEVRGDVQRFLRPEEQVALALWEADFFLERVQKIL